MRFAVFVSVSSEKLPFSPLLRFSKNVPLLRFSKNVPLLRFSKNVLMNKPVGVLCAGVFR